MKSVKKYLTVFLAVLLTMTFPIVAYAKNENSGNNSTGVEEAEAEQIGEGEEKAEGNGGRNAAFKEQKALIKQQKETIEALKEQLEAQKETLEAQYTQAEASGDQALIDSLNAQIDSLKEQIKACKDDMKAAINVMQDVMKGQYTAEELAQLNAIAESLSAQYGVEILPVENVLAEGGNVKFDTPPVIKEGRILIPVRAVTEAMGADVDWDQDTNTVTITKDSTTIIFDLSDGTVFVNDVQAEIDVPAEVMNNRTMVPIRFIAENLGLGVDWDSDSESVEITIPEPTTEPTTLND